MQSHADRCIFLYLSGAIQAFRCQVVASAVHIQDVRRGIALGLLSASATHNGVACSVRKKSNSNSNFNLNWGIMVFRNTMIPREL